MRKKSIIFAAFLALLYITLSSDIDGPAHHGHGDITGATTGVAGHCQTGSCHGGNNPLTVVQLQVIDTTTMLPTTTYRPFHTYLVSIKGDATAVSTTLPGFGFQASAVLGNHTLAGSYTIPTALARNIHTYACGATTVVEHTATLLPDTTGVNKYSVEFYWTAPAPFTDSVTFFALLNAVNGNGGKSGDYPNAAPKVTIYEDALDMVQQVNTTANHFSVYPNPSTGTITISYNLIFGDMISISVYDITGRIVARMADDEYQNSGVHQYTTIIANPGLYFVRMQAGNEAGTVQVIRK